MSDTLRYVTVESGREILTQLYLNDRRRTQFPCHIVVPVATEDSVEDKELTLYVARIYDKGHTYKLANNDLLYRTVGRFDELGDGFDIDIVIRYREADLVGATILISEEAIDVATRH